MPPVRHAALVRVLAEIDGIITEAPRQQPTGLVFFGAISLRSLVAIALPSQTAVGLLMKSVFM